jgi:hypothetical protein
VLGEKLGVPSDALVVQGRVLERVLGNLGDGGGQLLDEVGGEFLAPDASAEKSGASTKIVRGGVI